MLWPQVPSTQCTPDHQRVLATGFQGLQIVQHLALQRLPGARQETPGHHIGGADLRERRYVLALGIEPEAAALDAVAGMRVEGQDQVGQPGAERVKQRGSALHVGIGSGHRQGGAGDIQKVVLRIDHQQACRAHDAAP